MISYIKLENFYSIRDEVILDLRAANIKNKSASQLKDNLIAINDESLLKTIAIYGANASGKSNIIKAIRFCCSMVFNSHNHNEDVSFLFTPFKLDSESSKKPSRFEIGFILDGIKYEYAFTLTIQEILTETLYYYPKGRRKKVFERDESVSKEKSEVYSFTDVIKKPMDVAINTSKKTLYVSRASQMDRKMPQEIFRYFATTFLLGYAELEPDYVLKLFNENKGLVLKTLKTADSDIVDIKMEKELQSGKHVSYNLGESTASVNAGNREFLVINTFHRARPKVAFDFATEESTGTQHLFNVILRLIDVVKNNKVLLIDEIESSLHSDIVEFILRFFHASDSSQLIFTTHNTNLLNLEKLRKDQIYFVNKDEHGASELYSLYDFKDFRETMDAEKGYLQGRFDAVPYIDDSMNHLKSLING